MRLSRVLLAWLAFAGVLRADELSEAITQITDAPEYKASRWGMLVTDAKTGKTLYERDPDRFFLPASTTKLYSCATALVELGPDHRFRTPVYQHGVLADGVLTGDLILVASGDPTMGGRRGKDGRMAFADSDHTYAGSGLGQAGVTDTDPLFGLDQLAKQIRKAGVTEVTGEIFVDDGLFPKARGSGSGPELITPIVINDNVIDVIVTPGEAEGQPAKVVMRPQTDWIQMDGKVSTGPADGKPNLGFRVLGPNRITIRGVIPVKSVPQVRIYPLETPELFARAVFIETLRKNGITVRASVRSPGDHLLPTAQYDKLTKIAEYESEPLSELIRVTLKVSHNLYASTLPILVGLKHQRPTIQRGLEQQAKMLRTLGIDPTSVSFAGGAGGASADSTTPRAKRRYCVAKQRRAARLEARMRPSSSSDANGALVPAPSASRSTRSPRASMGRPASVSRSRPSASKRSKPKPRRFSALKARSILAADSLRTRRFSRVCSAVGWAWHRVSIVAGWFDKRQPLPTMRGL